MWMWLLRRLGQVVPTLLILSVLIFGLQQLMPGEQTAGVTIRTDAQQDQDGGAGDFTAEDGHQTDGVHV